MSACDVGVIESSFFPNGTWSVTAGCWVGMDVRVVGGPIALLLGVFFFQAEDGIRDPLVTGVQTCALPISTPAELAALPGVRAVRPALDRTALTVAEVHRAVPALLGLLERRGAELSLLATHHATLEDVFVSLTGRQLRDA